MISIGAYALDSSSVAGAQRAHTLSSSATPSSPPIPPHRFIHTFASLDVGGVDEVCDTVRTPPRGLRSYEMPAAVNAQSKASATGRSTVGTRTAQEVPRILWAGGRLKVNGCGV